MENKLALIEVKVTLSDRFKPRTMTYRAFSNMEKASEKEYVLKRAEELFTDHILEKGAEWKLKKEDLKIKTSVTVHHVHCYIPTENQVRLKFEKNQQTDVNEPEN